MDRELAELEATLWQLKPQLEADRHRAERTLADLEAQLSQHQRDFQVREQEYEQARDALNDRASELGSELDHTQRDLNDLQRQYEQYAEADMPVLERDLEALPQWREQHQQLRDHLEFMQQAVQASQAKREGRLRELADTLARQTDEAQALIDALGEEKESCRERHWEAQRSLEARSQGERVDLEASYQARLEQGVERLAELKTQLMHTAQTSEEAQEAELAQARLDRAQSDRSAAATTLDGLRREYESGKKERDSAERELEQTRQQRSQVERRCEALYRQRDPAQGSLRHFLRYHRPGWSSGWVR